MVIQLRAVELEAAELLEALLALALVVLARRVPSLCAGRAHEVLVEAPMISHHLRVPRARIKHVFASGSPLAVGDQELLPNIIAFDATLAS